MKKSEEIIVLDAGSDEATIIGPEYMCCFMSLTFFRY